MKRGEVWYVRSTDSYGTEMALGRPALIVCSDYGIEHATHIQVLWCTTSPRSICALRLNNMNDNRRDTYVLYNQIVTIDKRRFTTCIGEASYEEMMEVNLRVKQMLGLQDEVVENVSSNEELESEIENLRLELAIEKRMCEKILDELAKYRIESMLKAPEPKRKLKKKVESEIKIDVEELKRKMSTPKEDPIEEARKFMSTKIAGMTGKANVNTDSEEAIIAATGMSKQTAHEIVKGRQKYGGYDKLEDLLVVPRFGTGCLKKYGDKLTV